ncbi:MAG TPA: alpha/beta fold hydrolase [Lacunisphaera sp.]|jgi:dienelactone hydrolase
MKKADFDPPVKRAYQLGLTCTAALCFVCGSRSNAQCPLPDDIKLTPPSNEVPRDLAAFAGAWGGGAWGGNLPTFLVVEQVNADGKVTAIYSSGNQEGTNLKPAWIRFTGKISNGRLHFVTPHGAIIDFTIEKRGVLYGRYTHTKHPSSVELTRVNGTAKGAIIAAAARPVPSIWEEVRIPEQSKVGATAGKTLSLDATIYRADLPGRNPVVIFNHGSAGRGVAPAVFVSHAWDPALIFHSLGYTVVVPVRKGYGKSEGANIEESTAPQGIQLDSAVEDLDAVVEYLKAQPHVDPTRIVLAGQSRGGFLSVVYAGRNPDKVTGVLNFAGGWWGEHMPGADFNPIQFRQAGRTAKVPMLWLYAGHDSFYSLEYTEKNFQEFRAAGGKGRLLEVPEIQGEGHFLMSWPEKWTDAATAYLDGIEGEGSTAVHRR